MLDVVRSLVQEYPESFQVAENYGRLPLHYLVCDNQAAMDAVRYVVEVHPRVSKWNQL
jgi:hypothetical protein